MSMWSQLQCLCKKNKVLHEKVNELYCKSSFPYKIRSSCADWIEAQNWGLDLTTENGQRQAVRLYTDLLIQIQSTEEKMQASANFDLERNLDFSQAKDSLKKKFDGDSCHFVEEVRRLLDEELTLKFSSQGEQLPHGKGKQEEPRAIENMELKQKLNNLKQKYFAAENALHDLEVQQNDFVKQYQVLRVQIHNLDSQLLAGNLQDHQQNDILNVKNNYEIEKEHLVLTSLDRRNAMIDTYIRLAIEEANILQLIWQEISKWHLEQKQAITGLSQPRKGMLEYLDKLCDQGGELLYRMIQQVEQLLVLLNKVNFQDDRKKQQLQTVLKELTNDYLPMHLKKCFIIEQNIPDRILKVGSGKSTNFSMAVRILGSKAFGLDFSKPGVKMALFFEKDIPTGDAFTPGACEIINGGEKLFTVHHTTNACVAQFYSIQLRNVKRPDRGRNEELVTDQKFAFVFFTTINICNRSIPLKVISLPVILITQTSQEIMAKGTLIWDAAFSDEVRSSFHCRDTAKWCDVAAILNALFLTNTGRGLTEDHLSYLAKVAFREKGNLNFNEKFITEKQLIKDKLHQRDFSFWKWFWANLNLVKDRIKKEWQDGSIYGFISKEDVKGKLMDLDPGTFLLRFSETEIEVSQRSDVSGFLTLSFVERDPTTGQKKLFHVREYLSPRDILDKGLATILNAMEVVDYDNRSQKKQLLCYLWPKKPFEEVFFAQSFPVSKRSDNDYLTGGKHSIEIFLTDDRNRRRRQDSIDSSSNPSSPQSSTQFSPTNPPLSVITEGIDDIGDESQIEIPPLYHQRPMATVVPTVGVGVVPPQPRATFTHLPDMTDNIALSHPLDIHDFLNDLDLYTDSMLTTDSDGDFMVPTPSSPSSS